MGALVDVYPPARAVRCDTGAWSVGRTVISVSRIKVRIALEDLGTAAATSMDRVGSTVQKCTCEALSLRQCPSVSIRQESR